MRASVLQKFLAAIPIGLLAGCAVGPNYHRRSALVANPIPARFGDTAITNLGNWKTAGTVRASVSRRVVGAYDGTVATYRQTVLTAFQDVEDQLAAQRLLAQQLDEETVALASAQRTLDISNNRYRRVWSNTSTSSSLKPLS